jgi:hypothetical protein
MSDEKQQWEYAEQVAKYLRDKRGIYSFNPMFASTIGAELEEAVQSLGISDKVDIASMGFTSKVQMSLSE